MPHEHLHLAREVSINERHRRPYRPPNITPDDPRAFGAALRTKLQEAVTRFADPTHADVGGFDDRKLLKITLRDDAPLPQLDSLGIEILSQEGKTVVLGFASDVELAKVERRLATLARDGTATRKEVLYALEDFDHWTAADRTGTALRAQGFPDGETFLLDVELWPQVDRSDLRDKLVDAFKDWLADQSIECLDIVKQPSLVMARVRCTHSQATGLLRHRDVRTVDLPPRTGIDAQVLLTDIKFIPEPAPPADDAPVVAVLDTGIISGHPLLGTAVGDAQGYLAPHRSADDATPWHGTFVAGLALYGDVAEGIRQRKFVPELKLLSGKVFDPGNDNQITFVENAVDEAVRELRRQYGCKVFNLSYGDQNKVYEGRHVRGLAYTLDRLARELGVLFVVPTGNLRANELPARVPDAYPEYLLSEGARLFDPGTALNALVVGGLARHEASRGAQKHNRTIEDRPIARAGQPFPLTRRGPSVNGAIKPDLVEHAGNLAVMRSGGGMRSQGLGVVSFNGDFAGSAPFKEDVGTSFAAPVVAHEAARLLTAEPSASHNRLRALLGAHARWPAASVDLLGPITKAEGRRRLLQLIGYGQVDTSALYRSLDDVVTLLAEEKLACDTHHFYEVPIAESFRKPGTRTRELTVALAWSPEVRTTRLDYCASRLSFELVLAADLAEVERTFTRNRDAKEVKEHATNRWLSTTERGHGTLHVSRWTFRRPPARGQKMFVVVTRQDSAWSTVRDQPESYALAVVVADRECVGANLYAELQAILQARIRERERARVRG